jgi:U4/U6 small nuclear ribonucleoprotein PRP3
MSTHSHLDSPVFISTYFRHTVRLANLMKVLTSSAVQNPTKVEARVNREVALRREKHEKDNADRQLTPEQKRLQKERKKEKEEKKGLFAACFK